ncbi:hypothetical protein M430DRAFT_275757 [Amorphotheca resinae ATCC 22711]|uniref:Uncharacterized protein n=1 Tax=Amorphotheca resinae ATCC 22711 TaxID=857342 RepID=A0A2T3B160_AMORE|nr:hypothetical protein M430DRAFT_275757 [Amorphotheca resinae ATCC 22711]PSS18304.1 hypothetical protein M430DRAFT_275757 [Amorphotheca resinae ATCC 22711]
MASYESLHSLLLQRKEGELKIKDPRTTGLCVDNILGDPNTLATTSTSMLAWVLTFVASVIASTQDTDPYPNYCWFSVAFMLCLIVGIFAVIASDTTEEYHVAIVGFLAAGLILTTSSVNNLLYTSNAAKQAAASGFVVLSIVNIAWIFYISSPPTNRTARFGSIT